MREPALRALLVGFVAPAAGQLLSLSLYAAAPAQLLELLPAIAIGSSALLLVVAYLALPRPASLDLLLAFLTTYTTPPPWAPCAALLFTAYLRAPQLEPLHHNTSQ